MSKKTLAIAAAVGSLLAMGANAAFAGDASKDSAERQQGKVLRAWPRPARTTARRQAIRARATRQSTTPRPTGSTSRRASAKRWAA